MARITDMNAHPGQNETGHGDPLRLSADSGETLALPDAAFVSHAEILRDGHDLVLEGPDGSTIIVEGYFLADPPPALVAPNGATLTPELVQSFAQSAHQQYAALDQVNDASPVGAVEEVSGHATITRADGSTEIIVRGTPIYQGDVIETDDGGAVNIVFIDETSFAVSADAKLAIDEYVFDPVSESGESNFSVLRGMFVFTSGLIGRDDPDDVEIDTPVGSIGIRGTTIAGNVDTGEITVIEGAIVLRAPTGQEVTLATQFQTARFTPDNGGVEMVGVMDAQQVGQNFSGIGDVAPGFFAAIGTTPDNGADAEGQNNPAQDGAPQGQGEDGENQDAPVNDEPVNGGAEAFGEDNSFAEAADNMLDTQSGAGAATGSTAAQGGGGDTSAGNAAAPGGGNMPAGSTDAPVNPESGNMTAPPTPAGPNAAPAFANDGAFFAVSEHEALSVNIGQVIATDPEGASLSYAITAGNDDNLFAIDAAGNITVNNILDFETADTHILTVTVSDGTNVETGTYTINVTDVAEAPVVTASSFTIAEDQPASTLVGTVDANDPETGTGGLVYEIVGGNPSGTFAIDAATGEITVAGTLDYEAGPQVYDLTVRVTDDGGLSTDQTITINVGDVDDTAPTVTSNSGATLAEDGMVTITGAMLSATDPDSAVADITYTITTPPNAGHIALASAPGTAITSFTQADIDSNNIVYVHTGGVAGMDSFGFTVTDSLNGGPTGHSFSLTIADVNDAPILTPAAPALDDVTEDDTAPAGNSVSDLVNGNAADEETADLGIAVTQADNTNGQWQYHDGTGWQDMTGLSETNALLLDNAAQIRFVPGPDYHGTAELTYRAWDGNEGVPYGTMDITGSGSVSVNSDTATVTVTPVHDAPVTDLNGSGTAGVDSVAAFSEADGEVAIIGAAVEITAIDSPTIESANITLENNLDGAAEHLYIDETVLASLSGGALTVSGNGSATMTLSGSASAAIYESVLQQILYRNGSDIPDETNREISVVVNDGTGNSDPAYVVLSVTGVDDDDTFFGTPGDDILTGDNGNDTFVASAGSDIYDGGGGTDTLDYSAATNGLTLDIAAGTATIATEYTDNFSNIEVVIGTSLADTMSTTSGANSETLYGGGGDDVLSGFAGDALYGGDGNDDLRITTDHAGITLDGGLGDDDRLQIDESGTYDSANFALLTGVEKIYATEPGVAADINLILTANMLETQGTDADLQIFIDANDSLTLDLGAVSGTFEVVRGDLLSIGSLELYNQTLDKSIIIHYTPLLSDVNIEGINIPGAELYLNLMGGDDGFWLTDDMGQGFGQAVAGIGDVNNDGIDDIIMGKNDDTPGTGTAYVRLGNAAGLSSGALPGDSSTTAQSGALGVATGSNMSGLTLAAAGDFNNDGIADYIIGAPYGSEGGGTYSGSGAVQVRSGADGAVIMNLENMADTSLTGTSVAGIGDVNGDGYDDILVGAPGAGGNDRGAAYVLFGSANPQNVDAANPGTNGMILVSGTDGDRLGMAVSGAGDFNDDGYADFMVASPGAGTVTLVYGRDDMTDITPGTDTATISGLGAGDIHLYDLGDINGDGVSDIGIGSGTGDGTFYAFFGNNSHYGGANIDASTDADFTFTPGAGASIIGAGGIGDFNGDGLGDMAVAVLADGSNRVDLYVIYGHASLGGNYTLADLNDPDNAHHIVYDIPDGVDPEDFSIRLTGAGDVNGDGYDDLLIGMKDVDNTPQTDTDSDSDNYNDADGAVALVYGREGGDTANLAGGLASTAAGQRVVGDAGDNTLAQNDVSHSGLVMKGGGGHDRIEILSNDFGLIDGGAGMDTLALVNDASVLDFTSVGRTGVQGIEVLEMAGTDMTMRLTIDNIFDMLRTAQDGRLIIGGDGGNTNLLEIDDMGVGNQASVTAADLDAILGTTAASTNDGEYYNFEFGGQTLSIDMLLIDQGQVNVVD